MNPGIKSRSFYKIHELKEIISNIQNNGQSIPFIAIVESWTKPYILDAQLNLDNYQLFRSDRVKSKNGGSLLYILNSIPIEKTVSFDDNTCNAVICLSNKCKCIIISLYRPPNASNESFTRLLNFIEDFSTKHNEQNKLRNFIFGDFNFPGVTWVSETRCPTSPISFSQLLSFMEKNFLTQYVSKGTRIKNILDLFLTDDPTFVELIQVEKVNFSDHNLIKIFTTNFDNLNTKSSRCQLTEIYNLPDFSKLNLETSKIEKIQQDFAMTDWKTLLEIPFDKFPEEFNKKVYNILQRNTKLKNQTKRIVGYRSIRKMNRKIRRYKTKLLYCQGDPKTTIYKNKIATLESKKKKQLLVEKKTEETRAVSKIKSDSKYFFSYAKRFKQVSYSPNILINQHNETLTDPKSIANTLQQQFVSVFSTPLNIENNTTPDDIINPTFPFPSELNIVKSDIISAINEIKASSSCSKYDIPAKVFKTYKNTLWVPLQMFCIKSFETCQIPPSYKTQTIIPIHKKGDKTNPENWRPIAITPHPIKIFERVIRKRLSDYLEKNKILNENQHGFRKNRSCSTQLISHTYNIFNYLINGSEVDCIYLDYSKAFDKVDHNLLLVKLRQLKISKKYIDWLGCFLKGRVQTVAIGNHFSFPATVKSGVPQGSVLAPTLYTTYINDLPKDIKQCDILTFADDTKLISKINSVEDTIALQNDLNSTFKWSSENNMILNDSKFEMINFKPAVDQTSLTSLKSLPFCNQFRGYYLSNKTEIEPTHYVRDLGIFIDSDLSWSVQIFKMCKKARQISAWILNTFHTRDRVPMVTLFTTMVRPIVEYCCEIWNPHKIKDIVKIENLQRSFTFKITGMQDLNYYERLQILNLLSLQRRRETLIILNIWKIKHKLLPNSINLQFKEHNRSLACKAILPPLPRVNKALQTKFEESFVIRGAKLWNSLPPPLTQLESLGQFKAALKKYVNELPDRPPLPGYSIANRNSLIEIKR